MSEPTYRVKPLTWEQMVPGFHAAVPMKEVYQYSVFIRRDDQSFRWAPSALESFPCASIEDGKRLAEEHWRARLLEALEEA